MASNTKYQYFCIVIDPQKESANPAEELAQYQDAIDNYYQHLFYVSIIHDKDSEENGEPKLIHLHMYLEYPKSNTFTCKTILKELSNDVLHINQNQISVSGTNNDYLYIQYIGSHKNDQNKYQYDHTQARTNDLTTYEERYNKTYEAPADKKVEIYNDLLKCKTIMEFANKQGIDTANKYRNIFKDIKVEQQALSQYDQLQEKYNELNGILYQYELCIDHIKDTIARHKTFDNHIEVDYIISVLKAYSFYNKK